MLRAVALEIALRDGNSLFLAFPGDTCKNPASPVRTAYRALKAACYRGLKRHFLMDAPAAVRKYTLHPEPMPLTSYALKNPYP